MKDFGQLVPQILGNGTRVMIYAGDVDFICNWMGNKVCYNWSHSNKGLIRNMNQLVSAKGNTYHLPATGVDAGDELGG